jgi:bifunctional UDP-N-acetylglucosamine pyrophosphorylase/glucosamine-1-phosphate N-acetyltransferase
MIRSFSHLEGAHVGRGAQVGPFSRLRLGASLEADGHKLSSAVARVER